MHSVQRGTEGRELLTMWKLKKNKINKSNNNAFLKDVYKHIPVKEIIWTKI